jgi:hypothetical protein
VYQRPTMMRDVGRNRTPDTMSVPPGDLLTAQEAAAWVGVNERTIRRAIASGALVARK